MYCDVQCECARRCVLLSANACPFVPLNVVLCFSIVMLCVCMWLFVLFVNCVVPRVRLFCSVCVCSRCVFVRVCACVVALCRARCVLLSVFDCACFV